MAKIIVVSDNHGKKVVLENIYNAFKKDVSAFIHCGDSEMDPIELKNWHCVGGNNDIGEFVDELIITVNGVKIYVCHGHLNSYFKKEEEFVQIAKKHHCLMVCSGHTHMLAHKIVDGIHLINPGSLRYNRDGSLPSFLLLEFYKNDLSDLNVKVLKGGDYE